MKRPSILDGRFVTALLLFLVALSVLFYGVFLPGQTKFSNDGPLSQLMAQCHRLPDRFTGCWADLNSVGFNAGGAPPGISLGLQWLLGPILFSKFDAIIGLLILGLGAWCFFKQSRLSPLACLLGGAAVMLNSTFFSVACWGVVAHDITAGLAFFALAALLNTSPRRSWLRLILAGFAVGMGVTEGGDVGALFSLLIATFVIFQAWIGAGPTLKNTAVGAGRVILIAVCAAFLAAQSISGLVNTSIKGIAGAHQDAQTKSERWDWATQWSLPKLETLGLVAPGLFGYRSDSPNGGNYWGAIGRTPAWDKYFENGSQGPAPTGLLRYSGGGNYAGEIVVLLALWAAAQSLRGKNSVYNPEQRKWLWFWGVLAILSLLLAFGRFAPIYQLFYALPYASTIRNPVKFLYFFSFALTILFAFGVDGLQRRYMQQNGAHRTITKFEKYWLYGCGLVWVGSLLAWLNYARHRDDLEQYLQSVHVNNYAAVAGFSIQQAGWFAFAFFLGAGFLSLVFSGAFAGRGGASGSIVLGLLLVADLGLANQPWIVFWNYHDKYASNSVIDLLRDKPYEHRVTAVPFELPPKEIVLRQLYKTEWLQQEMPFYNIQSFDVVEMSRTPEDLAAFGAMLTQPDPTNGLVRLARAWQLTNTRYVFAPADVGASWNRESYLLNSPLQPVARFDIVPRFGISVVTKTDQLTALLAPYGHFGLFELPTALPRAKLYAHWEVNPDNTNVLAQLFNPNFDPQSKVFVAAGLPPDTATNANDQSPGSVDFVSYAPKDLTLKAQASAPAVLLLNDHFDPDWRVTVDGKPETLLRCNFLMRGVYLLPGTHLVEFKFLPPVGLLYVSIASIGSALLTLGIFLISLNKERLPATPAVDPINEEPRQPGTETKRREPENRKKKNNLPNEKGKPGKKVNR